MRDGVYLLNLTELKNEEDKAAFIERSGRILPKERVEKIKNCKISVKTVQTLGAGLLLMKAVLDCNRQHPVLQEFMALSLLEELEKSEELIKVKPLLGMHYNEFGKPYFNELPLYFSLSHSKDFCLCAFSEQEIGADIELIKEKPNKVGERFFSEEEKKELQFCEDIRGKNLLFYKLWTRKEAYGKMTGCGVFRGALQESVLKQLPGLEWMELPELENYACAVCKRRK